MSFGRKGEPNIQFPHALPWHSVDTEEEARGIQALHCRRQYADTYVLTHWNENIEDVFTLAERLGLE